MKRAVILFCFALIVLQSPAFGEKVFKYSTNGTATNLDPVRSGTTYSNTLVTAIFDTLFEYKYLKRPYELKPNLALALPQVSKDGLTYTIEIKKGVKFTDDPAFSGGKGREVTVADFIYSFKRNFDAKNKPRGAWLWQGRIVGLDDWKKAGSDYSKEVAGIKALGRYKLQIKLTAPYPQLTYTFAMGYSAIVAKEVVKKYGKEISLHPVGSGPFILTSFNSQKAILIRNPGYRGDIMDLEGYSEKTHGFTKVAQLKGKKLPIVDRVEVNFMKETSARWNSFSKGNEVQNASLQSEQMRSVLASKFPVRFKPQYAKKYNYRTSREFGFVYNNYNMSNSEIGYNKDPKRNQKNKVLRCALRKAFNWPQRVKRFYLGIGEAFPGIIPPGIDGYDPNLSTDSIKYDPQGAKKMLKEAGWNKKNLPVLEYHTPASTRSTQFFEQWRGWMKKVGYPTNKLKKKSYANFGDFSKAVTERKAMYFGMGWGLDYPDAENVLQLYYGPNQSPGSNGSNFQNAEYDRLYKKSSVMQPSPERSEIYKKMNKILIDECVVVSGFSRTGIVMWHKNLIAYPEDNVLGNYFKYVDVR